MAYGAGDEGRWRTEEQAEQGFEGGAAGHAAAPQGGVDGQGAAGGKGGRGYAYSNHNGHHDGTGDHKSTGGGLNGEGSSSLPVVTLEVLLQRKYLPCVALAVWGIVSGVLGLWMTIAKQMASAAGTN